MTGGAWLWCQVSGVGIDMPRAAMRALRLYSRAHRDEATKVHAASVAKMCGQPIPPATSWTVEGEGGPRHFDVYYLAPGVRYRVDRPVSWCSRDTFECWAKDGEVQRGDGVEEERPLTPGA